MHVSNNKNYPSLMYQMYASHDVLFQIAANLQSITGLWPLVVLRTMLGLLWSSVTQDTKGIVLQCVQNMATGPHCLHAAQSVNYEAQCKKRTHMPHVDSYFTT